MDYLVDKTAYARNCINKARPRMHCNGKCQLMKRIEEQEKKQQQVPEMKLTSKIEVISSKSWFATFNPFYFTDTIDHSTCYNTGSPIDQPSSFFHPPGA